MKLRFLTLLLVLAPLFASAQFTEEQLRDFVATASTQDLIQQNSQMLMDGNFYQSIIIADKLLETDAQNANFNYRKGFALLNSQSDFTLPLPFLEIAGNNVTKNYDAFSAKEDKAPVDAIYHLAKCYHYDSQYDKARSGYTNFIERAAKNSELVPVAQLGLIQLVNAEEAETLPRNYTLKNLGDTINFEGPDYSPVISLDGSALYFTSRRLMKDSANIDIREPFTNLYLEDIYVSYQDFDGTWGEPQLMEFCETTQNEATIAVSSDERRIYVYKDTEGNGDIFYSDFATGKFSTVTHFDNKDVNSEFWEPHCTVTPDGLNMYFTSDREGGFGGRDIYRVVKLPNGEWSEPQNLGPKINTAWDEDSPFIAIDNKSLYFSSNGEASTGGFDVFLSVRNEDNVWSDPINLGFPLNSTGDDLYYTTTVDGLKGYLTSFRKGGVGEKDIYEIKNDYLGLENIAVLKGEIETVNGDPIPEDVAITVRCLNCGDEFDRTVFPRLRDGVFFSSLEPCREYELIFHHNNGETEFHREKVNTSCNLEYDEIYRHILLDVPSMKVVPEEEKVTKFEPIAYKHFFGYNRNNISTETGPLAEFIALVEAQLAEGRPTIDLDITSSASKVPTRSFPSNLALAQTRAENLKTMLLDYFKDKPEIVEKININIKTVVVSGPEYERAKLKRLDIYGPHQFVQITSAGYNSMDEKPELLKSQDAELDGKMDLSKQVITSAVITGSQTSQGGFESNTTTSADGVTTTTESVNANIDTDNYINSPYQYHVSTGAFRRFDYANGMVESLKNNGFPDAKIIGKTRGLYVVSAGSYDNITEANKALTKAKQEVTPSAYILNSKKD